MASLENIKALYEALLAGEESPIEPQSRVEAYLYALCEQNAGGGSGGGSGGVSGTPGKDGEDGEDGGYYIPSIDADGNLTWTASKTGMSAINSANIKGPKGEDGKTPVKGTDYFTAADKQELVNSVLALLPTWEGGSY